MPYRSEESSGDVRAFPLTKTELEKIRCEAKEEFLGKLYPRLGPVIEKLLRKVTDSELQLTSLDENELAREYSVALRIGAAHFAKLSEEAVRSRCGRMDLWARREIERLVDQFLDKWTSEEASRAFFEKLEDRFTFVRQEGIERSFAIKLAKVRASGLLMVRSQKVLDRAQLIHGSGSTPEWDVNPSRLGCRAKSALAVRGPRNHTTISILGRQYQDVPSEQMGTEAFRMVGRRHGSYSFTSNRPVQSYLWQA